MKRMFSVANLFSKLKLVTDNLLFIYAAANWEVTENIWLVYQYSRQGIVCEGENLGNVVDILYHNTQGIILKGGIWEMC